MRVRLPPVRQENVWELDVASSNLASRTSKEEEDAR